MEVEKTLKKVIKYSVVIVVALLLMILFLDFINVTNYIPFTVNFDWLNLLGAIIGGVIGAAGTFLGLFLTIKNEQETTKKEEINKMKRDGYSYITFGDNPFTVEVSLDSVTSIANVEDNYSILLSKNVDTGYAYFCKMTFEFDIVNDKYPTGVVVNDLKLYFDPMKVNNKDIYKEIEYFKGYDKKYKKITLKNRSILAFTSMVLIDKKLLRKINEKLITSEKIDIAANMSFVNSNGVITHGSFSANLILKEKIIVGEKNSLGSNKVTNSYKASNTYLTVNEIEYVENMEDVLFK